MSSNKKSKTKELQINISPKQWAFISCEADMVLFGGAAGGGKSYGQLLDALIMADKYPGIKQLILRESFPELNRSLIMTSLTLYPPEFGRYNASEHKWYANNGSSIEFGYLESDASVQIYQSAEYDVIRVDEASHMNEYRLTYMKSRIRGANDFPKQMKLSTNPGGVGHKFLKKTFKIGVEEPNKTFMVSVGSDRTGKEFCETRCFIPASIYDNRYLMKANPDYIKNLLQLPEKERKALLDGSWDICDDQAFPEFDYRIHVCEPFVIPEHWKRWRSVDNGYNDPFAWYWYAVDEQGTVYIYREYTRDSDDPKVIYSEQAMKVAERSTYIDVQGNKEIEKQEKIAFTVAGHDAWQTHVRDVQGKTLIDHYNDGGVYNFVKAVTDRRLRKAIWHEYLAPYKDEITGKTTAKVQIFNTCKKLIETLPEMLVDPQDNEKVLDIDDHWYDAAGYGLIAHHAKRSKAQDTMSERDKDIARLWKARRRHKRAFV